MVVKEVVTEAGIAIVEEEEEEKEEEEEEEVVDTAGAGRIKLFMYQVPDVVGSVAHDLSSVKVNWR